MTRIKQKADAEAKKLVQRLWVTYWVYNSKTYECAKSAAIIVAMIRLKDYRHYNSKPYDQQYDILKSLPKAIYRLKFQKK